MIKQIQNLIEEAKANHDVSKLSDGYHTFDELYEFRHLLFIALINQKSAEAWRAKANDDGQKWTGWFVAGINPEPGRQVTFHLPDKYWNKLNGIKTYEINPHYDGHTSRDVLKRLGHLF